MSQILKKVIDGEGRFYGYQYSCKCEFGTHVLPVRPRTNSQNAGWVFEGPEESPTFKPSILSRWSYRGVEHVCHHFVENGQIRFLGDCTHEFAGKTIDMEPVEE